MKIPKRYLLQLIAVAFVMSAEFLSFYILRNGLGSRELSESIRGYLAHYGGLQFALAAGMGGITVTLLFVYFSTICLTLLNALKNPLLLESILAFRVQWVAVLINFIFFIAILFFLIAIQDPLALMLSPHSFSAIIYTLSPILWLAYLWSLMSLLFPLDALLKFIRDNKPSFISILFLTILGTHTEIYTILVTFWASLLLQPAVNIAIDILFIFGLNSKVYPGGLDGFPVLGTEKFQVEILPGCSGYEGVSLVIILLTLYLFFQRSTLRFPHSFIIIPVATIIIFLLNILRIAILISIGHFYSPELAINGFHMVAGWLNLLIVFILSLLALNLTPFFQKCSRASGAWVSRDFELLFPLLALIAASLITKSFTGKFQWLYPIPVGVAAITIFYFRVQLSKLVIWPSRMSVVIGVLIFIEWLYLVPIDDALNKVFFQEIQEAPLGISMAWILIRIIGATLVVPIAEELAFRGFILPHLEDWINKFNSMGSLLKLSLAYFKTLSIIFSLSVSSLLFGVLHSDFLAATIAGVGYGLVYLYRRRLIDAVVSHCTTNALLAINVIYFGNWSYW